MGCYKWGISPLIWATISIVTLLVTPHITTREPPSWSVLYEILYYTILC